MREVSIVGTGQIPVQKDNPQPLRTIGADAVLRAMDAAGVDRVDALFAGNMLADELQGQKHIAALVADEAGLAGVEALQVRAATATGAAALRMAYFAVASGEADLAIAMGVEKMGSGDSAGSGDATSALAKALDAELEVIKNATMISQNAFLMQLYRARYQMPEDGLVNFAINAHYNALSNPNAMFHKPLTRDRVMESPIISPPIRLLDCSPICDGAAAVVLAPRDEARAYTRKPVHILASSVATDNFRVADRHNPLSLKASRISARKAFRAANINIGDISFYELHDAFSIMACLQLESVGFAQPGEGWRMAEEKRIFLDGDVPIATFGGLKARGHPIGATAIYQTAEIVQQLTESAGENQVANPQTAMLQSVGGAATTVITHIFGV